MVAGTLDTPDFRHQRDDSLNHQSINESINTDATRQVYNYNSAHFKEEELFSPPCRNANGEEEGSDDENIEIKPDSDIRNSKEENLRSQMSTNMAGNLSTNDG